ncbi:MAG: hypothetical protein KDJ77_15685 [Rhodobiaceae bacterium]|nr:hypothetical protein [Rhodobiaceae bacterium]
MIDDKYDSTASGLESPPSHVFAITPDDNNDLAEVTRGLMVASGGDVAVVTLDGDAVTLPALAAGVQYAFRIVRVKATGTTATGLVGLV